jgi:O-antigen/teichoic acid export membrane protein
VPAGVLVALVALMTTVWAVFNVQDQVLTGLNAARWTLFLNGPANLGKLLLTVLLTLPLLAVSHAVVVATVVPAAVAVLVTVTWLVPRLLRRAPVPAATAEQLDGVAWLGALRSFAVRDTAAIGLLLGVGLLVPFLVTVLAGPVSGALYALAYQISVALDLVTTGVATALAKNSSGARSTGIGLSGQLVGQVLVVVAVAAVAITAATPLAFGLLGRDYDPAQATLVVALLSLGCVVRSPYGIWSSLMRAHQRVTPVLIANASAAVVLVALVLVLVPVAGPVGAAGAMLVAGVGQGGLGVAGLRRLRRRNVEHGEEQPC